MTEYRRVPTKVERLRIQAAEAAAIREALEDPNVVALMVERVRRIGGTFIWAAIGIFAVFTIITVHRFVARGDTYTLEWFGAWFLEPGLVSGLLGILIWEGVTSKWRVRTGPMARTAKWGLLAATLTMNVWLAVVTRDFGGFVAHTVPPLGITLLTEARIEHLDRLAECVQRAHAAAAKRRDERIAEQARVVEAAARAEDAARENRLADARTDTQIDVIRSEAGVQVATNASAAAATRTGPAVSGQPVPERSGVTVRTGRGDVSRTGPDRPDFTPAVRPGPTLRAVPQTDRQDVADRLADRPGGRPAAASRTVPPGRSRPRPGGSQAGRGANRKPAKRARTDEQLAAEIRDLTAANEGATPSAYQVKQVLGVGSERAQRLLEQVAATTTAAGEPHHNGAARQETDHT